DRRGTTVLHGSPEIGQGGPGRGRSLDRPWRFMERSEDRSLPGARWSVAGSAPSLFSRKSLNGFVVDLFERLHPHAIVVLSLHLVAGRLTHSRAQQRIDHETLETLGQRVDVVFAHQKTGLAVIDDLWNAAMICAHG